MFWLSFYSAKIQFLIILTVLNEDIETIIILMCIRRVCLGSGYPWRVAMHRLCPSRRPFSCTVQRALMARRSRCNFGRRTRRLSCPPPCCPRCPDKRTQPRFPLATRTRRKCSPTAPSICCWLPRRSIRQVSFKT